MLRKTFFISLCLFFAVNIAVGATVLINSPYDFGLKTYYPPVPEGNMKQIFEQVRAELPDEIPVVMPREVKGAKQIFVAPSGNDNNAGTISSPLGTIEQALYIVKRLDYAARAGGVVIYLREGVYKLNTTLSIIGEMSGTKDAPLFISSYNNEKATITPSDVLSEKDFAPLTDINKLSLLPEQARDKVYVADLTKLGITNFPPIKHGYEESQGVEVALYWNNLNMSLARWPNYGYVPVGNVLDKGPITQIESGGASGIPDDGRGIEFELKGERPLSWKNTEDIYFYGFMCFEWLPQVYKVRSINPLTNSVRTYDGAQFGAREQPGNQYYFFNVFEELDAPGEWYLDRKDKKLYIYPYEGFSDAQISLSTNGIDLINVKGAKNVYFNGLSVSCNSESGFVIRDCENVVVQNCDISLMGKHGVDIIGSRLCGVTTCTILNTDKASVQFGGNDKRDNLLIPTRNFLQNSFITRQGNGSHAQGFVGGNTGDIVSHNLFQKFAAGAATPTGAESIFEYNEITGSPYEVNDMGSIYTGSINSPYHHDRYNYIHDMSATAKEGVAIYYDVFGSGYFTYGNVLKNVATGIYSHGGRYNAWFGNVISSRTNSHVAAIMNSENYYNPNNPSWRNQMLGQWDILGKHYNGEVDMFNAAHAARYPMWYRYILKLYDFREQFQMPDYERGELENWLRLPSGSYISNNISYNHGKFQIDDIVLPVIDLDNNIETSADPGFVDFKNNNLNFKETGRPFKELRGFVAPPFDKMGLVSCDRWDSLAITETPSQINPPDKSFGVETFDKVVFKWSDVLCAGRYRLLVANDPDFTDIVVDRELDLSTSTERLTEPGHTYYWKVTATPMAKSINPETVTTPVKSFTTMTFDEMNIYAKADKQYLQKEIAYSEKFVASVSEGTQVGEYAAGTKAKMTAVISEAKAALKKINIQVYIDEAEAKLRDDINSLRVNVVTGSKPLVFKDNWTEIHNTETGEIPSNVTEKDGVITLESKKEGSSRLANNTPLQMGIMYTYSANIEVTDGWLVMGNQKDRDTNFASVTNYCIIVKPDLIELQKYTETKTYFVIDAVTNNNKIIKPNEWHNYEFGILPVEKGVNVVLKVDGNTVIDYLDTDNPLYYEGNFVTMSQPTNKSVKFKQ